MKNSYLKFFIIVSGIAFFLTSFMQVNSWTDNFEHTYNGENECDLSLYADAVNCTIGPNQKIKAILTMKSTVNYTEYFYIINGYIEPIYNSVSNIYFSDDGKHYGYLGTRENGTKQFVIDGIQQREYGHNGENVDIGDLVFSPDGKSYGFRYADYNAENANTTYIVNGTYTNYYYTLGNLIFSKEGQQYSYLGVKDTEKEVYVVNGREGKIYKQVSDFFFSIDGSFNAYIGTTSNDKKVMVINGLEQRQYDQVAEFKYDEDTKTYSYIGRDYDGTNTTIVNGTITKTENIYDTDNTIINPITESNTSEENNETPKHPSVDIVSKIEARKNYQISKINLEQTKAGQQQAIQVDHLVKNFTDEKLVEYYNKLKILDSDMVSSFGKYADFVVYLKDSIVYEIHVRDNITKNIID